MHSKEDQSLIDKHPELFQQIKNWWWANYKEILRNSHRKATEVGSE